MTTDDNALNEIQRRGLTRWLQERDLDMMTRDEADSSSEQPDADAAQLATDVQRLAALTRRELTAPPPAMGQIRLLHPAHLPGAGRLVRIAILDMDAEGVCSIVPFSPYGVPAIPGEWRTPREEQGLRVLCLWNVHRVAQVRLRTSWILGELTLDERTAAKAVLEAEQREATLPEALRPLVGPPLNHPLDPRHEYLDEEAILWLEEQRDSARPVITYPTPNHHELARAAESSPRYGRIPIPGTDLAILFADAPTPGHVTVQVVNPSGTTVNNFDEAVLENNQGIRSTPLREGLAIGPTPLQEDGGRLLLADGSQLKISW